MPAASISVVRAAVGVVSVSVVALLCAATRAPNVSITAPRMGAGAGNPIRAFVGVVSVAVVARLCARAIAVTADCSLAGGFRIGDFVAEAGEAADRVGACGGVATVVGPSGALVEVISAYLGGNALVCVSSITEIARFVVAPAPDAAVVAERVNDFGTPAVVY